MVDTRKFASPATGSHSCPNTGHSRTLLWTDFSCATTDFASCFCMTACPSRGVRFINYCFMKDISANWRAKKRRWEGGYSTGLH